MSTHSVYVPADVEPFLVNEANKRGITPGKLIGIIASGYVKDKRREQHAQTGKD